MMKYNLFVLLVLAIHLSGYSQIQFEKGYFINNDDKKIDCLIRNSDWRNSPTDFDFKLNEEGETGSIKISSVKEFSIPGSFKFIRSKVRIDRSSDVAGQLGYDRNPIWEIDTLFLKVIVEGKATLYSYSNGNLFRFFLSKSDSTITQLIYKRFLSSDGGIIENKAYQQQLLNELSCGLTSIDKIKTLKYNESQLKRYFITYFKCIGDSVYQEPKTVEESSKKPIVRLTAGILNTSNTKAYRFGVDIEYGIYSRNKWAFVLDPNLLIYNFTNPGINTLSVPLGVRYYFHLTKDSRLFVNAFLFTTYFSFFDSKFLFNVGNPALGGGALYKRISIRTESIFQLWTGGHLPNYSLILGFNLSKR